MAKMIITDLDQTLLRSEKYISEYTIDVLKKCRQKGIKIVFATARSTQSSSRFIEQFPPDIFVGYGGALVLVEDKVIQRFDIPADISNRLIYECLQESDISSVLAINESIAYTNERGLIEMTDSSHYQHYDFSNNDDLSYLKISLIAKNPNIVERIAVNYPMCDLLRYTGEDLYRFANRNAVKWNAIASIAEYYNVGTDDFISFGDDINDLEMIAKCGTGVAVENAVREVKSVANYICDTNDNDGVAKWIEKRIL